MRSAKPGPDRESHALDVYLRLAAKGTAYRRKVALETWETLTPAEKLALQESARELAGNDLRLGAELTWSALLFKASQGIAAGAKSELGTYAVEA